LVSKYADGRIHVETKIKTPVEPQTTSPLSNTRFQAANRAGMLTAFSLASVMGATAASGQETGLQLPTIDVTGDQGGYQATQQSIVRMPVPLLNTPQSVTVIPQQVIKEQSSGSLQDVLRNVAGITFRAGEGGNGGDDPYIRGFDARNDMFRDGVRDPGWYTRDLFATDRVEVYKGPSSFLFGRGSTGGVINTVTKTPKDKTALDAELSGVTPGGYRATVDANGKINENVAARIAVMSQDIPKAGRDLVEQERWGVAPSVKVKLGDSTQATASYIYQHTNHIPDYGIPFVGAAPGTTTRYPAAVPRSNFYGVLTPSMPDVETNDAHIATLKIEHEFNNQFKIANTTRYADITRFLRINQPPGAAAVSPSNLNVNLNRNRWQLNVQNSLWANQTDMVGKFQTWGMEHSLVAGLEFTKEDRSQLRQTIAGVIPGTVNVANPDPYPVFPGTIAAAGAPTTSNGRSAAAYVADQVKLNKYFELLGGLRFENFKADSGVAPAIFSRSDSLWSWRVGAIFHPIENTSLYVTQGTSFNPSAEFLTLSAANANISPEENETTEIGAKADVLGGRLSLATAVFRTDKTNARVPDPTNTALNILSGVTRVEGFEISAQGKLTDKWEILVNYTHLNSEIVSTTTAAQRGKELVMTPNNAFSLWTTYAVTNNLTVGGGAYYVGSVWGDVNNTTQVPDYWRFDAMASYALTKNLKAQLNINNITDEYYFESAYSNWAVPAAGRSAILSLKYSY
jgi:catecholate siderophore receptor